MNLVSLLIAPAVVTLSVGESASTPFRLAIAVASVLVIVAAIVVSKRRASAMNDTPAAESNTAKA